MDLAKRGALAKKQERYRELLEEIGALCEAIQGATLMMLPGNLDDIKEERIALASQKLTKLLPEGRQLKKELEAAGICIW